MVLILGDTKVHPQCRAHRDTSSSMTCFHITMTKNLGPKRPDHFEHMLLINTLAQIELGTLGYFWVD